MGLLSRKRTGTALLLVCMVMLTVALVPHHHHGGVICVRCALHDEARTEDHHHGENDDPCCQGSCALHFHFLPVSSSRTADILPVFTPLCLGLVPDSTVLLPALRMCDEDTYPVASLLAEDLNRSRTLRAPPCVLPL